MGDSNDGRVRPREMESSSDRVWPKAVLLFLSTFLALGAAELVLRATNPFGFRLRGNTLVLPVHEVYDIEADARSRSDQLDPRVIHTKNSLGFRGPDPPADFGRWLTLVAVGGSTTECFYLSDGKDWPSRLAENLRPDFDWLWVNNAGLDGQSTFGHLLLTREYLLRLQPKVTIYLAGVNEMFTDVPREYDEMAWNPAATIANHSELAATLLNLYRYARTSGIEDLGTMPKPVALRDRPEARTDPAKARRLWAEQEPRVEAYRDRLERLVRMNRERGIDPVLMTQPSLLGGVDRRTGIDTRAIQVEIWETVDGAFAWRLLDRYNDVTRAVGAEMDVLVIDVARELPKDSTYFYDFFHFTNEGASRVGEIAARALTPWLARRYPEYSAASARHSDVGDESGS